MKEQKMSDELKPCPFCGCEASREFFSSTIEPTWGIFCDGCHASAAQLPSKTEAITAWNTRALEGITNPSAIGEVVNLLEEMPELALAAMYGAGCGDKQARAVKETLQNMVAAALAKLDNEGEE